MKSNDIRIPEIKLSKRMYIDCYGDVRIKETELQRLFRKTNKFQLVIGCYLFAMSGLTLWVCRNSLLKAIGLPADIPVMLKMVLLLVLLIKVNQLLILSVNYLSTKTNLSPVNSQKHAY